VITGFNTDIEHDGVVYHVQTEDKGLDSPLILSLVYSGGAILAAKRSRYEDLIAEGFSEEVLAKRLKRQHRLICAAINAGRLEELKRMGAKPEAEVTDAPAPVTSTTDVREAGTIETTEIEAPPDVAVAGDAAYTDEVSSSPSDERVAPETRGARPTESAYSVYDPRRQSPEGEIRAAESGFALSILDEDEFRAGESYSIRVLVEDRSGEKQRPLNGVGVSVKVLGTAFRPQIYSVKTERDGVAVVPVTMPGFITGRAAVLVRVVVKGEPIEVRRVIHPAE
jgi:hypothetical protein